MALFPRVLIAPDKFKGTLTAAEVGDALAAGMTSAAAGLDVARMPIADGGDGSVEAALRNGFRSMDIAAAGPLGEPGRSRIAVRGSAAVIELAAVCGLQRLAGRALAPVDSSTFGLGEAIQAALAAGATKLIVGLGGSASTDGGAGMLVALGARLLDAHGHPVAPIPRHLPQVRRVDLAGLDPRLRTATIEFAADVDNPLLGPRGAAHAFGAQKGADDPTIEVLEKTMAGWARLLTRADPALDPATAGSGAAGGTGFAAQALGACLVNGAEAFLRLIGFPDALPGAALVVTGEGRLDEQTLMGKGPAAVARHSASQDVPCIAVVGSRGDGLTELQLRATGFAATYEIVRRCPAAATSGPLSAQVLMAIGADLARDHLLNRTLNC